MAFFRGEEGSVAFDNGSGTVGAIASTTAWTLDTTKDTLECTAHGDKSRKYVGSLISDLVLLIFFTQQHQEMILLKLLQTY